MLLMSTVPVVIKLTEANPWLLGIMRLSLAALVIFALIPSARRWSTLSRRDWLILASLGACFGLHWLTYFFSIKVGSATVAVIATVSFHGIFVSCAGALFLSHRIRWYHGAGLVLALAGSWMFAGSIAPGSGILAGFFLGVLSGLFYGALPILHQKALHLSATLRSGAQFTLALPVFLPFLGQANWSIPLLDWAYILYLTLAGTVVAHGLWVSASSRLPTTISSLLGYLYIPGSAAISYFALGERLSTQQTLAAIIIVGGSTLGMVGGHFFGNKPCLQNSAA